MVGRWVHCSQNQRRIHRRRLQRHHYDSANWPRFSIVWDRYTGGALSTGGTFSARAGTALSITVPAGSGTGVMTEWDSGVVKFVPRQAAALTNCRRRENLEPDRLMSSRAQ